MKTITVKADKREGIGKKETKRTRNEGKIPAVVYGNKGENMHITVHPQSLKKVFYTPEAYIVDLEVEGEIYHTIVKDSQFHPLSDDLMHVDFLQISEDKPVEVTLPVKLIGLAEGVKSGGKLNQLLRNIKIKGNPFDLESHFEVNVSSIKLGRIMKVSQLPQENIEITTSPNAAIASVIIPRTLRKEGIKAEDEE